MAAAASRTRAAARERWPILKLAICIAPAGGGGGAERGDAVSTAIARSVEACRFLIDELKRDVAIWKKEVWGRQGNLVH